MIEEFRRRAPRLMFYCHDSYGLGHLRRTLTLADYLRTRWGGPSQLIVTGSPVAQSFPLPAGADYVKLPCVVKTDADRYEPRSVDASFGEVRDMRRDILLSVARHFQPDALIVDHVPAGLHGEAIATLRYLKQESPHTRLIAGLRDVIDDASRVRRTWTREGVYELLGETYDRIFVYGEREIYDVVREYGLDGSTADKVRHVGFLRREPGARTRSEVRAELGLRSERLVLVTAGGGGDGFDLFRTTLEALRERSAAMPFDCLLVGGPLMSDDDRRRLRALAAPGASVRFMDFTDDMASYLGAADVVVAMGGYNTVCEILSLERPAIIVPRVQPRQEQLIRARLLAERGVVRMIHPDELTPVRLLTAIESLLDGKQRPPVSVPMNGLPRIAEELGALLDARSRPGSPRFEEAPIGAFHGAAAAVAASGALV